MNSILTNDQHAGYTYQHIQGCMLLSLNKMASQLKLSHAEYRIMSTLIGYWNKQYEKAYPTTRQLTNDCCLSNSTLKKGLDKLMALNLIIIVKDSKTRRQNYHINQNKFLTPQKNTRATTGVSTLATPCSSNHDKTNRFKQIEQTSKQTINDASFKTKNLLAYKNTLKKLHSWGMIDSKKILAKNGVEKVEHFIQQVENRKPDNAGAYLRSLLDLSGVILPDKNNASSCPSEEPAINKMVKSKYWQHIPSGQKLQVTPDIGQHFLIKYHRAENMVTFLESGLTDKLENFKMI
jgi:predicted transcriptional regulator